MRSSPARRCAAGDPRCRRRRSCSRIGLCRRQGPSRQDALREVVARTSNSSTAVLASTGFCGRELYAIDDRPNHLYMVGSMGCVVPLALGLALARPDLRVIALDGDGAALMRMGAFATVGTYGPANLQHLLLDNGAHDSTGGQATVSPQVSFAQIAAACGYASSLETDDVGQIGTWLNAPPQGGPRFARLLIRTGTPANLPRPLHHPGRGQDPPDAPLLRRRPSARMIVLTLRTAGMSVICIGASLLAAPCWPDSPGDAGAQVPVGPLPVKAPPESKGFFTRWFDPATAPFIPYRRSAPIRTAAPRLG